jgi:hypothetical protein
MHRSSAARPSVRARFVAGVVGAAAITALAIPVLAGPAAAATLGPSRPVTSPPPVTTAPPTTVLGQTQDAPATTTGKTVVRPDGRSW